MNTENLLTGLPEIDTPILYDLDNKTFYHLYHNSPYVKYLCENDYILKKRIHYLINLHNRPRQHYRYMF